MGNVNKYIGVCKTSLSAPIRKYTKILHAKRHKDAHENLKNFYQVASIGSLTERQYCKYTYKPGSSRSSQRRDVRRI